MTRTALGKTLLLASVALLAPLGCTQVLGIGDPETCTEGTTYCDGVCADTLVDPANCGPRDRPELACGNSCQGASCVDGSCVDPDCNRELATCVAPQSASADCHGLDCVEFAAFTRPVCLRRCRSTDDCPYDYFCAPRGETSYAEGFVEFVLGANHCVPSFCGGGAGSWYANGVANGGCRVGGDGYIRPGAVADKPGTCVLIRQGTAGFCFEAGRVPPGGSCTLNEESCVERSKYEACGEGHVCLGQTGVAEGTCYQVCDPRATGQCPAGMTCRDKSLDSSGSIGACEY